MMLRALTLVYGSLLLLPAVTCIQKPDLISQTAQSRQRAAAVKASFKEAYADYLRYGYPHDEVLPLSRKGRDTRNGWGATLVDSLDTLYVMGLTSIDVQDYFNDAIKKTLAIDFSVSKTNDTVSVFETTIRYLGGILSAYELTERENKGLLKQAVVLGDKLSYAWATKTQSIPYSHVNFTSNTPTIETTNLAEAGTLILEFDRLSTFSGNDKYRQLAQRAEKQIINGPQVFPGLPPQGIDPATSKPIGDYVTWGGASDSYLEYLNKYALLTHNSDPQYLNAWKSAVLSSIKNLATQSSVKNLTYLADYTKSGGGKQYRFSHLACFVGGNWLLGAKQTSNRVIYDYALKLVDTCMNSYTGTATGIGPESFGFVAQDGSNAGTSPSPTDILFYSKHGFFPTDPKYILRPEVIESAFYAWRITGDKKYQDFVWKVFQALLKYSKAPASFASLSNVNFKSGGKVDDCESFLYAETFKYIYLIFAPPTLLSLDEYVFSTEAHPYRYASAPRPNIPGPRPKKSHSNYKSTHRT